MSVELDKIKEIAKAALMPDFFAVRIDEEELYGVLQRLIASIRLPSPMTEFARIQKIAAASPTSNDFITAIKKDNLWPLLRDILTSVQVKS